jgi:ABC-type sugar transport system ATPase subunit
MRISRAPSIFLPHLKKLPKFRLYSQSTKESSPIIQIQNATFYRHHPSIQDTSNNTLFPDLTLSLPSFPDKPQSWALIGTSSAVNTALLEILWGKHLCFPPESRTYPYLLSDEVGKKDPQLRLPERALQYVGFGSNQMGLGSSGTKAGYLSARYESYRDETDFSLLDYLTGNTHLNPSEEETCTQKYSQATEAFQQAIKALRLDSLLDLPVGNLSNGQTRRARIAKALVGRPEVLLLDEPFSTYSLSECARITCLTRYSWIGSLLTSPALSTSV